MISERVDFPEKQEGIRLNGVVFISLLIHVILLSLLFFSPSFPSPKLTFGPVYNVSLVSFSGNIRENRGVSSVAKELMAAGSIRSETVLKKSIDPAPVIPIQRLETRKKTTDPDIEKAMEEIRKRAAVPNAADKAKPQKSETAPEKSTSAAAVAQPGDAESKARMNDYYAAIWSRIKGKWALPQGILPGDPLETVVDVTILRNGAVARVDFEKRSGNRYFDESTVKAVQKANPFPPLPSWIGENSIELGIRFHSSALKP